ncbi:hypothetical protein CRUP_025363 [Coryphaenoides rupestris]|nr:hypothetical protein CRUP_025363 [Coryphaenoides rupestris]
MAASVPPQSFLLSVSMAILMGLTLLSGGGWNSPPSSGLASAQAPGPGPGADGNGSQTAAPSVAGEEAAAAAAAAGTLPKPTAGGPSEDHSGAVVRQPLLGLLRRDGPHKGPSLDQTSCSNYDTPVWANTGKPLAAVTEAREEPDRDRTHMIVYIICGVVAIMVLVGIFTKLGLEKSQGGQTDMTNSR